MRLAEVLKQRRQREDMVQISLAYTNRKPLMNHDPTVNRLHLAIYAERQYKNIWQPSEPLLSLSDIIIRLVAIESMWINMKWDVAL